MCSFDERKKWKYTIAVVKALHCKTIVKASANRYEIIPFPLKMWPIRMHPVDFDQGAAMKEWFPPFK